jgi:hypothetical protein
VALPSLSTHWKFLRLSRVIGGRVLARGVLETLWEPCWNAGDAYIGTSDDIEALCEWAGERGALTKALLTAGGTKTAGFIEPYAGDVRDKTEPHYQVHDFLQHCSDYVRRRRDRHLDATATKTCALCAEPYYSRDSRSKYCGDRCRQTAHRRAAVTDSPTSKNEDNHPPREELRVSVTDLSQSVTDCHTTNGTVRDGTVRDGTKRTYAVGSAATLPRAAAATEIPGLEEDDGVDDTHDTDRVDAVRNLQYLDRTNGARKRRRLPPVEDTSPVILTFPVVGKGGPVWHLREAQIALWHAAYPDLDVIGEARRALVWINADTTRRKTFDGMARCLVAWFNRAIDSPRSRAPNVITGSLKTAGNAEALKQFLRGRGHVVD